MEFQAHGGIDHVIDSASTSPGPLATLVTDTLAASAASRAPLDMRGAEATPEILHCELERRAAGSDRPGGAERGTMTEVWYGRQGKAPRR